MRILWVKVGGLWPLDSGGRLRSYHMVSELSHRHDVSVLTTHAPGESLTEFRLRLPRCREVLSVPHAPPKWREPRFARLLLKSWFSSQPVDMLRCRVPALERAVGERLRQGNFDLCVADFLFAMPNVPADTGVPVVLFAHNVEHMIWRRVAARGRLSPRRAALELEWRKTRRYESRACRKVARTVAVSRADRDVFLRMAPAGTVGSVSTGVDLEYFAPRGEAGSGGELVYVGSMDWYPNEEGVRWFITSVLPRVRSVSPDVHLTVVGRNPGEGLRELARGHGVTVTGTVDDVRDYLARAAVCIVPLRIGGGTRLKIFEALAMGKATVSTSIGAEGLPLISGRHVVLADGAPAFADAVTGLLADPARRRRLGAEGRRLVAERYGWERVTREFEAQCSAILPQVLAGVGRARLAGTA